MHEADPHGVAAIDLAFEHQQRLIELVERHDFEPISYEQARERLSQEVWQREMEKGYREWLEELRADTYLDRRGFFADSDIRFGGGDDDIRTETP